MILEDNLVYVNPRVANNKLVSYKIGDASMGTLIFIIYIVFCGNDESNKSNSYILIYFLIS